MQYVAEIMFNSSTLLGIALQVSQALVFLNKLSEALRANLSVYLLVQRKNLVGCSENEMKHPKQHVRITNVSELECLRIELEFESSESLSHGD